MGFATTATQSNKMLFGVVVSNGALTTYYTAPANSASVPTGFPTACVKEIIVMNNSATTQTINIAISGVYVMLGVVIPAYDSKIITGLNMMLNASQTVQCNSSSATTWVTVSGCEYLTTGGVLSTAIASPKQMTLTAFTATVGTTIYTSPATSVNVPAGYSTAYIKEIVIGNTSSSPVNVWITIHGGIPIIYNMAIGASDTKILSGLNLMLPPSANIQAWASIGGTVGLAISGVEVQ